MSVCCGITNEHVHMCYLGPLGWIVYEVLPRLWRRMRATW